MILYDLPAGMHPRRVRIFIAEKGLTIPTQVVDAAKGENHQPEFLRLNPMGRLPVLELDDGTALSESLAICCIRSPRSSGRGRSKRPS
jgi:glutathione S-transferase